MSQAGAIEGGFFDPEEPRDKSPYSIKAPAGTKRCPFCHGEDLEFWREPCTFMSSYECIKCKTCHACGPSKGFDDEWNHGFTWNHREGIL